MIEIRRAEERDKPAIWRIVKTVIAGGDTYVFSPDTSEDEMMAYWFTPDKYNYVALEDDEILGIYWIRANYPGFGAHVANAAYMVSPTPGVKASANEWPTTRSIRPATWVLPPCNLISS